MNWAIFLIIDLVCLTRLSAIKIDFASKFIYSNESIFIFNLYRDNNVMEALIRRHHCEGDILCKETRGRIYTAAVLQNRLIFAMETNGSQVADLCILDLDIAMSNFVNNCSADRYYAHYGLSWPISDLIDISVTNSESVSLQMNTGYVHLPKRFIDWIVWDATQWNNTVFTGRQDIQENCTSDYDETFFRNSSPWTNGSSELNGTNFGTDTDGFGHDSCTVCMEINGGCWKTATGVQTVIIIISLSVNVYCLRKKIIEFGKRLRETASRVRDSRWRNQDSRWAVIRRRMFEGHGGEPAANQEGVYEYVRPTNRDQTRTAATGDAFDSRSVTYAVPLPLRRPPVFLEIPPPKPPRVPDLEGELEIDYVDQEVDDYGEALEDYDGIGSQNVTVAECYTTNL